VKHIIVIIFFGLFLASGCHSKKVDDEQIIPEKKLIFGVVGGTDPGTRRKMMEPIVAYLSKKLGMTVEFVLSNDYTAVIEALKAKKIHMADIPPYAYVIASKTADITPIIVLGADGKPNFYRSMMIASKKSGLKTMDDVRARAKNLNLCFAEPASASGHLIPKAFLISIGLDPQKSFKEVLFGGGHQTTVFSVKSGKVDIGCTTQVVLYLMVKKNEITENEFTTIWTSDPIVAQPIVVRNDLNKDFVKKIQNAYLDMANDAPETLRNYLLVYRKDPSGLSYMVAYDSMYDGLRKIASGIKELN
jgi:phosphonate transport system substrate-binding protein